MAAPRTVIDGLKYRAVAEKRKLLGTMCNAGG
jgi:hypothetical protein